MGITDKLTVTDLPPFAKKRQTFPIADKPSFYVVWGAHSKVVRKRHPTRNLAKAEAKRLAALTGGRFYILKAVARVDGEATIESNPDCLHGVVVQNGCPSCERRIGYKLESGDETDVHG